MSHIGCKHLDYETEYVDCHIETIEPEGYKYWHRDVVVAEDCPRRVQFCKKRGRINNIFSCINKGEQSCFEAQDNARNNT
jgi:hypothetical protein